MPDGYAGKLLFVDLTKGTVEEKDLTDEMAEKYVGGYGIGAKVLYDNMPANADPLGPENILGFVTGPATATKTFFSGRYTIVHKSPVTDGWNDANSGGFFGPELKKAGYDGVFISGISEKPVYLWINDGKVEIKDASKLWGKDTKETWELLKEETGEPRLRVSAIGPSGENCAYMSCPINDGHRAPGRGGGGAVMGSKKLKAIAVRGTQDIKVANPDRVAELNKITADLLKKSEGAKAWSTFGTGVGTGASALSGDSPVKNWGGVGVIDFGEESANKLAAPTFDEKYKTKPYACANCPMGCGAVYKVEDGRWPLPETERPEYETASSYGSTLLCDEIDAIMKCNEICNIYGIDTISAGMTIAWAMECYDNGILSKDELDGIDLTWGNGEAIVQLTQKIADGEGIGAILMHGSAYAAEKLGKGEQYLQTASGIELPMHDPRFAPGFARTYQYDPTPGRHVKGSLGIPQMAGALDNKYDYEDTGKIDVEMTAAKEITNTAGFCMFMEIGADPGMQKDYIAAVTGKPFTAEDVLKTGIRIYTMRHAFNLREGITLADMKIAPRAVGKPPLEAGPLAGITVDNEKLGDNFFNTLGWDKQSGKPPLEELKKLGMDEVARDLYNA